MRPTTAQVLDESAASQLAGFDFQRDRLVGALVAKAGGPSTEIRPEVAPQEPDGAEFAPLPYMDELVGEQRRIAGVVAPQQDDAPQRHGRHTRGEAGDVDDPRPGDVGRRHEWEVALDAPDGHRRQPTMLTSFGRTRITLRGVRPARCS